MDAAGGLHGRGGTAAARRNVDHRGAALGGSRPPRQGQQHLGRAERLLRRLRACAPPGRRARGPVRRPPAGTESVWRVFAVGALAGALAQSFDALLIARVIQGAGAGLVSPAALAGAVSGFPPERRGSALGIWGASAGMSNLAGPLLGGLLTVAFGWRANWWALLPLTAGGRGRHRPAAPSDRECRGRWREPVTQPGRAGRDADCGAHLRGDDRRLLRRGAVSPARGGLLRARSLGRARPRRPPGGHRRPDRRQARRPLRREAARRSSGSRPLGSAWPCSESRASPSTASSRCCR